VGAYSTTQDSLAEPRVSAPGKGIGRMERERGRKVGREAKEK